MRFHLLEFLNTLHSAKTTELIDFHIGISQLEFEQVLEALATGEQGAKISIVKRLNTLYGLLRIERYEQLIPFASESVKSAVRKFCAEIAGTELNQDQNTRLQYI